MAEKHRLLSTDAQTREGIPAAEIVELLVNHTFGRVDLDQGRIKTAEILLKKSLPDIQMVNIDVQGGVSIEVLHVATHDKPAPAKKAPAKKRVSTRKTAQ
jgi:hypothetical protein